MCDKMQLSGLVIFNLFQVCTLSKYRKMSLPEKYPNAEHFLVRILLYSDWMQENTDQKKLDLWTFFTQCMHRQITLTAQKLNFLLNRKGDQAFMKFKEIWSFLKSFCCIKNEVGILWSLTKQKKTWKEIY